MFPVIKKKRLILILVSIIILGALIGFSIRDRENITLPEKFVHDSIGWIQTIFNKPVRFVQGTVDDIQNVHQAYEQNEILKARLAENKQVMIENQQLKRENEKLQSMLEIKQSLNGYRPIEATVIARSSDRWFNQMIINRGEEHGVEVNMAVITGEGMVGKIQSTQAFHSTVKLLSGFDRTNQISVEIHSEKEEKDKVFGLIQGYDDETKKLLMKEIRFDAQVEEGEMVISSGKGGAFPRNLLIGEIAKVEMDQFGLTQTAYIEPAADLYDMNHVMVVDRDMPTYDFSDEEKDGEE
ncbi:rod shape-determining protein MreC [Thalassobacillus hwangdonensis]|uniref:Cell shape-determining protein MreC n=1 Tax=Thalassobacillus hwangdonensis TaxID=546108 RepID=A0ABW3L0M7_9BACI